MLKIFQQIGHVFRSVQGWIWVFGTLLPLGAAVMAFLEDQPWSGIIFIATATLSFVIVAAYCSVGLMDYIRGKLTKYRIIRQLQSYKKSGYQNIDLPTAAAIWVNTGDIGSIERHLCFRKLKAAIYTKKLRSFGNVTKANKNTHVLVDDLVRYFENDDVYK